VECISGIPFYEYVNKNIFEPLGMKNTTIHPVQADNRYVAEKRDQIKGHSDSGKNKPKPLAVERIYIGLYPAGSATGTAEDAVKFLAALVPPAGEAGVLFKSSNTLNEMLSVSYSGMENFPGLAHGFFEYFGPVKILGHGGNTAAFSSLFTFAPDENFALVVMTNQAGETSMCSGLTKALYGEYKEHEKTGKFPDAKDLTGLYIMARRPANGFTKLIMAVSSMLPLKFVDENTLDLGGAKLVQVSPLVFVNTGGNEMLDIINYVGFQTDSNGKVSRASVQYFDLLPVSTGQMLTIYGSVFLLVLCFLYLFAGLIIIIISSVKRRKKSIPSNKIRKLHIILYSSMAAALVNNALLAGRALSFSSYSSLQVHFIINIIFIIFAPVCIGLMTANRKNEPLKTSKVFYTFTMVFSAVLAMILTAWEFWR